MSHESERLAVAPADVGAARRRAAIPEGLAGPLFEQTPVSTVLYDAEGHVLAVNAAFTAMWGADVTSVPAGYTVLADPELERQGVLPLVRRAFAGEPVVTPPIRYDISRVAAGGVGRVLWSQGHFQPVRDAGGRVTHVILVHVDLTERMEREEALRASRQRLTEQEALFRTLADSIPQLAWVADAEGSIFWYNDRWYAYTGTTLEEMRGSGWTKVHHPEHVARVVERFRESIRSGEAWEDTFPLRSSAGEYRWFLSRALPVRDAEGHVVRWFGTNTDITEQLTTAAERERLLGAERRAREDAEAANRAKSEFLAKMSHELRTPLNAIAGYTELLELGVRGPVTDAQRQDLARIRRSEEHLLRLIDDILDFSKIEAGAARLEMGTVRLADVLAEVEPLVAPQFAARGIHYEAVPCDPALVARGDRERIVQVCLNLLTNAIKATAPGGRVTIDCEPCGEDVCVRVRDTGVGIPADALEAIFSPFTQLGRTLSSPREGVGLGLAISRELARAMGGDLTARSREGEGATFILRLRR